MPAHHDGSSRGTGPRGRLRRSHSSLHAAGRRNDGILVLVPHDPSHDPSRDARALPADPMPTDAALAQLRAERDVALEEIAFLKEQLRSMSAYHAHLFEQERAYMHAEHQALLRELALLGEELQRRAFEAPTVEHARGNDATGPTPQR